MPAYISKISESDAAWKYRLPTAANREGLLLVSENPRHEIYFTEYGNPQGEPVFYLHGGPGGATSPEDTRFFDPERYRILLFDQRGCGKSIPHVAIDPKAGLADNDTPHMIADIEKLRDALQVTGKMHVFGGSWGSTFALSYAIAHPAHVATLALRGIFLTRKEDLDYFYQGNAAVYAKNPFDTTLSGTYGYFPEEWKRFVEVIPLEKRGDMIKAYGEIFAREPKNAADQALQLRAVTAWTQWEGSTIYLSQAPEDLGKFGDEQFAKAFARIENHYFMNGCFLGGKSGETWRGNNFLLENLAGLRDIPIRIVHGRYDLVCPRFGADALVEGLTKTGAKDLKYFVTPAGHSAHERENVLALTSVMDAMPRMR